MGNYIKRYFFLDSTFLTSKLCRANWRLLWKANWPSGQTINIYYSSNYIYIKFKNNYDFSKMHIRLCANLQIPYLFFLFLRMIKARPV